MNAFPTRIETIAGRELSPTEIFAISRSHEAGLSQMLMAYLAVGLAFMLLPGTFLGVWNLFSISGSHSEHISPAWIQAHGHAQVLGWVGTFILGIGFYSIPKLRGSGPFALSRPWAALALWTVGVGMRWLAGVYGWHWRLLLPLSALLELAGFLLFFATVSGHRPDSKLGNKPKLAVWTFVVMLGTFGFLATLLANAYGAFSTSLQGQSAAFPHGFDQKFLVLAAWGFLVMTVWGFTARWVPTFVGLAAPRGHYLLIAAGLNLLGVVSALAGFPRPTAIVFLVGAASASFALRIFEPAVQPPKIHGVHPSFPVFLRLAYAWMLLAGSLGVWAAFNGDPSGGIGGASRHALTVGFISLMIFGVGQRVLPAFTGMKLLYSRRLMFLSMLLASIGCAMRVTSEMLAYPGYAVAAWHFLPVSAVIELTAFTLFAINLSVSIARRPPNQPAKLYSISSTNSSIA
jgi:uncharacterized protein involved in response to NO